MEEKKRYKYGANDVVRRVLGRMWNKRNHSKDISWILKYPVVNLYCLYPEKRFHHPFYCGIPLCLDGRWLFFQGITEDGADEGDGLINMDHIHQIEIGDEYSREKRKLWEEKGNMERIVQNGSYIAYLRSGTGKKCKVKTVTGNVRGRLVKVGKKGLILAAPKEKILFDEIIWIQYE